MLKNYQNTHYPRLGLVPKTGIAFPKTGVLFLLCLYLDYGRSKTLKGNEALVLLITDLYLLRPRSSLSLRINDKQPTHKVAFCYHVVLHGKK